MMFLELAKPFKTMNRPKPARPSPTVTVFFSRKVLKIETWNFDKMFIQVFNLCYKSLDSISFIFGNHAFFGNVVISPIFIRFFHHSFQLKRKFWYFHRKNLVQIYQNIPYFILIIFLFFWWKIKKFSFF